MITRSFKKVDLEVTKVERIGNEIAATPSQIVTFYVTGANPLAKARKLCKDEMGENICFINAECENVVLGMNEEDFIKNSEVVKRPPSQCKELKEEEE